MKQYTINYSGLNVILKSKSYPTVNLDYYAGLIILLIMVLLFSSCGNEDKPTTTSVPTTSYAPTTIPVVEWGPASTTTTDEEEECKEQYIVTDFNGNKYIVYYTEFNDGLLILYLCDGDKVSNNKIWLGGNWSVIPIGYKR
jgi:hypothetical protein